MKTRTSTRITLATAAALAGLALATPSPPWGGGDLLWSDAIHEPGGDAELLALDLQGGVVYAAGSLDAAGNYDALLSAYDARTGSPLWQERYDRAGDYDRALDVAVAGSRVHVAGLDTDSTGNTDYSVRTFDRRGRLLWEDHYDQAGLRDLAIAVCAQGGRVFTAGRSEVVAEDFDFVVRAYDGAQGTLLWQDQVDGAGQLDNAACISAQGGLVVAAGYLKDSAGEADFYVRAYAARTGQVLWEDRVDGPGSLGDLANAVVVHGGLVFAGGRLADATDQFDFFVRAYDGGTGTLLWEDVYDLTGGSDVLTAIAVHGGKVFAVGLATPANFLDDLIVRAYDVETGSLLWMDLYDQAASIDSASAVAAQGETVFVGGVSDSAAGDYDFLVRAYDAGTGAPLWTDLYDRAGGTDACQAVAAGAGMVFACGDEQEAVFPGSHRDGVIRVYDGW